MGFEQNPKTKPTQKHLFYGTANKKYVKGPYTTLKQNILSLYSTLYSYTMC